MTNVVSLIRVLIKISNGEVLIKYYYINNEVMAKLFVLLLFYCGGLADYWSVILLRLINLVSAIIMIYCSFSTGRRQAMNIDENGFFFIFRTWTHT